MDKQTIGVAKSIESQYRVNHVDSGLPRWAGTPIYKAKPNYSDDKDRVLISEKSGTYLREKCHLFSNKG